MQYVGKVLTLKQPWASAIAYGGKDIENRSWTTRHRGKLAIHAGSNKDREQVRRIVDGRTVLERILGGCKMLGLPDDQVWIASHVVAVVQLVEVLASADSPWYIPGNYAWVIRDVVPIVPVPMRGKLGLWNAEFDYRALE